MHFLHFPNGNIKAKTNTYDVTIPFIIYTTVGANIYVLSENDHFTAIFLDMGLGLELPGWFEVIRTD